MIVDVRPSGTIASVERALDVLDLFSDSASETLGVTEIAHSLGLSKAVVFRILATLRSKGYVDSEDATRRYRLGARALHLGQGYLESLDIRALARPVLEELCRKTNETTTLSIRNGWNRVYVDQVTPERDVKMMVQLGRSVPLHAGASSKAFLAFIDDRDQYLKIGTLTKLTGATICDPVKLAKDLREVRVRGYAVSFGERMSGAGSVAAPVFGHTGDVVAVVSVSGPVERFRKEVEEVAPKLLKATESLSRQLGFRT